MSCSLGDHGPVLVKDRTCVCTLAKKLWSDRKNTQTGRTQTAGGIHILLHYVPKTILHNTSHLQWLQTWALPSDLLSHRTAGNHLLCGGGNDANRTVSWTDGQYIYKSWDGSKYFALLAACHFSHGIPVS